MNYFEKLKSDINYKSDEMESFIDNSRETPKNNENIGLTGKAIKFIIDTKNAVNEKLNKINPKFNLKTENLISYVKNRFNKLSFSLNDKQNLVSNLTKSITYGIVQKFNKILGDDNKVEPITIKNTKY